jgi:hypothetical protein
MAEAKSTSDGEDIDAYPVPAIYQEYGRQSGESAIFVRVNQTSNKTNECKSNKNNKVCICREISIVVMITKEIICGNRVMSKP